MKTPPKNSAVIAAIFCAAGIAGTILSQAQEITVSGAAPSADSIVALAADSQSLLQVAPSSVPVRGGTFWWVYPGGQAIPTPMLPPGSSVPIYAIKPGKFLVDLTGGTVLVTPYELKQAAQVTTDPYAAAVTAQVQGLVNLITKVQTPTPATTTATTMTLSAKPMGGPLDPSQGGYPYLTIAPTGTNQFSVTVINTTNPSIYELWWTPALANANYPWQQLVIGASGQTNFTVNNLSPNGFFKAVWDTNGVPTSGLIITIDSPLNGTVFN
jgi:hypothetical protein